MTISGQERLTYRIDGRDVIAAVNDAWAPFAQANQAPQLTDVVGQSVWDHVADDTTRQVYRDLIAGVRAGRIVTFTYRCDAPALRRFMRMTMLPEADGGVAFDSVIERAEPRPPVALLDSTSGEPSAMVVRMCSWCKRAYVEGGWHEIEIAVERLGLFSGGPMPGLTHGMCEDCYARVTAEDGF